MTHDVAWRKATASTELSNCVEVARAPGLVRVRDSKNAMGPRLAFTSAVWQTFLDPINEPAETTHLKYRAGGILAVPQSIESMGDFHAVA